MAELVDALVSGTSGATRGGSSPLLGTKISQKAPNSWSFFVFGGLLYSSVSDQKSATMIQATHQAMTIEAGKKHLQLLQW
jgi:hypothetical protein